MNIFFGGATNWPILIVKIFFVYMWAVVVGVVFPRFRVEQSIQWWYKYALPLGIIAIIVTSMI